MKRRVEVDHRFVDVLPAALEAGIVYISGTHNIAAHLCCCGCGAEIVTPLGKAGWTLRYDGQVTLSPSIGSGALACKSHYVVESSRVRWLPNMTSTQHRRAHERDRRAAHEVHARRRSGIRRLWAAIFGR